MIKVNKKKLDTENDEARLYSTNVLLTDEIVSGRRGDKDNPDNSLLQAVLEIPGVEGAIIHPYNILVIRSKMFEWESVGYRNSIESRMLCLLSTFSLGMEGRLMEETSE